VNRREKKKIRAVDDCIKYYEYQKNLQYQILRLSISVIDIDFGYGNIDVLFHDTLHHIQVSIKLYIDSKRFLIIFLFKSQLKMVKKKHSESIYISCENLNYSLQVTFYKILLK